MSAVSPETPSSPDCLLSIIVDFTSTESFFATQKSTIAGSRSPDRVPITSPSSGVKPIEVSTDWPRLIAHADAPLPRCSVMIFVCFARWIRELAIPTRDVPVRRAVETVAADP